MKPQILCKLTAGKAIGAFDGFVDTFNWLVDFCNNLKGEGDIDNSKTLKVDVSVGDAPVIRGGGGDGEIDSKSRKITLVSGSDSNLTFRTEQSTTEKRIVIDCYYV